MTTQTTLTAADIDPRGQSVPWEPGYPVSRWYDTPEGAPYRKPRLPREGWQETSRAEAAAAAQAGGVVIVRCSLPWSTPNGASGWDEAYCTFAPGFAPVTNATWEKYVGRSALDVAAFGGGSELNRAIWTYYTHAT